MVLTNLVYLSTLCSMMSLAATTAFAPSLPSLTFHNVVSHSNHRCASGLYGRRPKADNQDENAGAGGVDPAKQAALQGVMNQIERAYGRGSIVRLGDELELKLCWTATSPCGYDVSGTIDLVAVECEEDGSNPEVLGHLRQI